MCCRGSDELRRARQGVTGIGGVDLLASALMPIRAAIRETRGNRLLLTSTRPMATHSLENGPGPLRSKSQPGVWLGDGEMSNRLREKLAEREDFLPCAEGSRQMPGPEKTGCSHKGTTATVIAIFHPQSVPPLLPVGKLICVLVLPPGIGDLRPSASR